MTKFSHFAGINLDELGMLTSHDLLRLNKLVSQGVINQRKVYAHNEARYQRRASLMASTNIEQVLIDPTGTRRFPTFKVTSIDYMHTTNYNQLYAQIKHLLDTGYQFWYDRKEIRELNIHNERFLFLTPEEEFLLTYFTKEKIHDQPEYLTVSEILKRISHRTGLQLNSVNVSSLGKILHKRGFESTRTNHGKFYKIYEIGEGEVALRTKNPGKPLSVDDAELPF